MLLWQTIFDFNFGFRDIWRPQLVAILDACKIGRQLKFGRKILINKAKHVKYNYFLDDNFIDNVTLPLWKFSEFKSRQTVGIAGDFHTPVIFHYFIYTSHRYQVIVTLGIIFYEHLALQVRRYLLIFWMASIGPLKSVVFSTVPADGSAPLDGRFFSDHRDDTMWIQHTSCVWETGFGWLTYISK